MPLVRISHPAGVDAAALSAGVHRALVEAFNIPKDDLFHITTEHPQGIVHAPAYLGVVYSEQLVVVQIFANEGRSVAMKKDLYAKIAQYLHEGAGLRREDVFIGLVEVKKENWSFGNGLAQYAPADA